jgi:RNA polymerase sigma factor (TIGR02999 family)
MTEAARTETTQLLLELSRGDAGTIEATNRLFELLYNHLHRLASGLMRGERRSHTLQPTALVNEAYVRMVDGSRVEWKDRAHFICVAARVMRRILVGYARKRKTARRGGGWRRITLDTNLGFDLPQEMELLDLDRVMTRLTGLDAQAAQIVEMRVFGGMTVAEVAHLLNVSERTVYNDWYFAKLWLAKELAEGDPG